MSKLNDLILNILLIVLVIIMLILTLVNWSSGLNFNNISDDFFAKDFITSIIKSNYSDGNFEENLSLKPATKIGYKNDDEIYGSMYDSTAYQAVSTHIYELFDSAESLENSSESEYLSVFDTDEYVFLEYFAPLCSISNNSIDTYVTNLVLMQNSSTSTAYIKSQNQYFKYSKKVDEIDYNLLSLLSEDFNLKIDINGVVNLISNTSYSTNLLNFLPVTISDYTNILNLFLYNPDILDSYQTFDGKTTYINDFSTLTVNPDKIEFKSTDSRGNITSKNTHESYTGLINFAISIFDKIYIEVGSELTGFCSDIYANDNQTTVIISAKWNEIEVDTENIAAIFTFTGNNLSSCEVNLFRAQDAFTNVEMARTSALVTDSNIVLLYSLRGNPVYKNIKPKE